MERFLRSEDNSTSNDAVKGLKVDGVMVEKPELAMNTPEDMALKARGVLEEVLIKYFSGKLPGQSKEYNLKDYEAAIIRSFGHELFSISPYFDMERGFFGSCALKNNLNQFSADAVIKEITRGVVGDYALEIDVAKLTRADKLKEITKLVPEVGCFYHDLLTDRDSEFNRATLNPYTIVLGMDIVYRPLNTCAIEKAVSQNRIMLPKKRINKHSNDTIKSLLVQMKPSVKDYTEVAKEYAIKEVLPAMEEFDRMIQLYCKGWRL